jgi:hydrogenase/urease accessory protein HupE
VTARVAAAVVLGIIVVQALVLHLMGRVWICSCGTVRVWVGDIWSAELSQQLFDWYTPSHIVHGILFYGLLRLVLPRAPVLVRLLIAVGIEVSWEIAENSPWVIEAYRQQALAAGYTGDSILNSLSDTVAMMTGFALARLLPWKATVALVLVLEIGTAALVRDNLTLNILNFIHHFPAVEAWQMRAQR